MSCKLRRGPRWVLSMSRRCAARRRVTFFFFFFCSMRQSHLLLRRAVIVLENLLRGGHSAEVHDTARMPPEGYEVIFARRGGSPPSFSLLKLLSNPCQQSNLSWCPCAPKPQMSLHLGQMRTCFLVWPSPQEEPGVIEHKSIQRAAARLDLYQLISNIGIFEVRARPFLYI